MLKQGSIVRLDDYNDYYVAMNIIYEDNIYHYLVSPDYNGKDINVGFATCENRGEQQIVKIVDDPKLLQKLFEMVNKK